MSGYAAQHCDRFKLSSQQGFLLVEKYALEAIDCSGFVQKHGGLAQG